MQNVGYINLNGEVNAIECDFHWIQSAGKWNKSVSLRALHCKWMNCVNLCLFIFNQMFKYNSTLYIGVSWCLPCRNDITVQRICVILANDQLEPQIFNTFITILYMYMFRAISCSSSGGQIVLIQHLVLSLSVSVRPVVSSNILLILRRSNCINTASGIFTENKWVV
jgi:hypothetical protein